MMLTARQSFMTDRLGDLERTLDTLNGQLREVRWELQRTKAAPLAVRLWRSFLFHKDAGVFMSAVCNRRIRPNMKLVSYDSSRTSR